MITCFQNNLPLLASNSGDRSFWVPFVCRVSRFVLDASCFMLLFTVSGSVENSAYNGSNVIMSENVL